MVLVLPLPTLHCQKFRVLQSNHGELKASNLRLGALFLEHVSMFSKSVNLRLREGGGNNDPDELPISEAD